MTYKRYKAVYHLENGKIIQDIKEFYYKDLKKTLERVVNRLLHKRSITAIDSSGSIIRIVCDDIVKVELNQL